MLSTAKYFKTKADYISFKPHRKVSCQQVLIGTAKRVFLRFCAEVLIMSWGYMTQDFGRHDRLPARRLRNFKHNNSPE